ncbi:MAG: nitroreductase family deazaflavin-dependent oxidoreductase [Chloroflexota bacterium]|jgi:deazaflavin-dependent oxidoreductase (nitroreductase family)
MDGDLAAWGKAITLEATGRRSGQPRRVVIGFVEDGEALLVAAATETTHWAQNLLAAPRCQVELRGRRLAYRARPLLGAEAEAVVVALILKYGTPAERLGDGPAFRLEPA